MLATAVPILLTLPISISPYEHPFSKIKLIRLYLWSTVSQDLQILQISQLRMK